jgi:hypothetical protein
MVLTEWEDEMDSYEKFGIVWLFKSNEGEEYDDEERFCGHNSKTTLNIAENLTLEKLRERIEYIDEIPASYGDGVTNSKILCVFDMKDKQVYPLRMFDKEAYPDND